jgi:hypothetical protein
MMLRSIILRIFSFIVIITLLSLSVSGTLSGDGLSILAPISDFKEFLVVSKMTSWAVEKHGLQKIPQKRNNTTR